MTQTELEAMLADADKIIEGDLQWVDDQDHSPAVEFRTKIKSQAGYPLFVNGRYNPLAGTLSFTVIHRLAGRIYALDLGADHHNPTCERVGERHKHRWTEEWKDKQAYVPKDVTAEWNDPVRAWQEFCAEAKITHQGTLAAPIVQETLFHGR